MWLALCELIIKTGKWAIERDWSRKVHLSEADLKRQVALADRISDLGDTADRRLRQSAVQRFLARERQSPDRGE